MKDAIQNHQVLVGMNREMVIYSKGRAPKKIREKDGETEYEDWIYGDPPQAVDFVRMVGDEVVRVETMKVNGEKVIRTAKEVDLDQPTVAKAPEQPTVPSPLLHSAPGRRDAGQPSGRQLRWEGSHADCPAAPIRGQVLRDRTTSARFGKSRSKLTELSS